MYPKSSQFSVLKFFSFFLILALANAACSKKGNQFPGTREGAQQLIAEFLKPGVDQAKMTQALKPTKEDYQAVFIESMAAKAEEGYQPLWNSAEAVIKPKEGQTEKKVYSATVEDLKNGTGEADQFPGGYQKVVSSLKPGLTFYAFKFVKPGEELGMSFDGLVYVNNHWVIFPKPWRALGL